jgi:2',3'-cyclic-nucleotide 2'-phosphodiesterase (5'-nucleotidase family)
MGVHAVAVGALDLALGAPQLRALSTRYGVPLLSANLQNAAGIRLFPAHRVLTAGGIKIGVFGLTGKHRIYKDLVDPRKHKLADPIATAKAQVKALRAKGAKLVVALAAIGDAEARKMARAVPGIDFVFVSGTGRHRPHLQKVGTAYLTEVTREGKYIGHLELHLRKGSLKFEDLSKRFVLAQSIERLQKSLQSLRGRMEWARKRGREEYMQNRLQRTQRSLARLRSQLYQANQKKPKGSFLTHVLKACKISLPENQAIANLIRTRAKAAGLKRPRGAK